MDRILRLINNKNLINGKLLDFCANAIEVMNPTTHKIIGTVPSLEKISINEAINSAYSAFEKWSQPIPK